MIMSGTIELLFYRMDKLVFSARSKRDSRVTFDHLL